MKIWYQTFNAKADVDSRWRYYEEGCKRYIPKVARPGTELHFSGVDKRAEKMIFSNYIKYMHLAQIIELAVEAEREGFDALILGGMFDLGYAEIKEAVDIPVIAIGETSLHIACMLAGQFAVIHSDKWFVQMMRELLNKHGLSQRALPGAHLSGYTSMQLIAAFEKQPASVIEDIKKVARVAIDQGAEMLLTDFAPTSIFLAEHGVRDIDGVPVLDSVAAAVKMAELAVDFRKLGIPKARPGSRFHASREDLLTARRVYGIE